MRILISSFLILQFFTYLVFTNETTIKPTGKYKPIIIDKQFEHNKWGTSPSDLKFHFAAFITSFDSKDDNNGDNKSDIWGIPEWVAFEIKKTDSFVSIKRPPTWMTDDKLFEQGVAPKDATYKVSGVNKIKEVNTSYRFVRGHLCPKNTAERISINAGYNTHTTLNAVPQLQWQNNGIWKELEKKCTKWADKYERVWVVTGPVFFGKNPAMWLGQEDEIRSAIPDALFKIVIKEDSNSPSGIKTIAFLIPNILPQKFKKPSDFITSIGRLERLTGLSFLTNLDQNQKLVELHRNEEIRIEHKKAEYENW